MHRIHVTLGLTWLLWGSVTASSQAEIEGANPDDDFHTSGEIRCWVSPDAAPSQCPFGVQREGDGTAVVTLFLPGDAVRVIRFENGVVKGAETASGPTPVAAEHQGGLIRIRIGEERYEIPDDLVEGG